VIVDGLRRAPWIAAGILLVLSVVGLLGSAYASVTFKSGIALLAAWALWRPWPAFLAAAGLAPVAAITAAMTGGGLHPHGAVDATIVVALIAWCRWRAVGPPPLASWWRVAAYVLAAASLASATMLIAADGMLQLDAETYWLSTARLSVFEFFVPAGAPSALYAAMPLLAGPLLSVACVDLSRSDGERAHSLARVLALGAAGAASLNLIRLVSVVGRADEPWRQLAVLLDDARFDVQFNEANATGPYFAAALPLAAGLIASATRRRALWCSVAILIGCGVWLSGSRSALGAAVLASAIALFAVGFRALPWRALLAATVILVLMVGAAPERLRLRTVAVGLSERALYAKTSLRMFASAPVYGVGLGRYYELSHEYAPPALVATWPAAVRRENAHNNFLQVLAELGLVGLACLAGLFAAAMWPSPFTGGRLPRPLRIGAVTGLAAFVIAANATHPLLVRPVAYFIFLMLGTTLAMRTVAPISRAAAAVTSIATLGLLAVTIPMRAEQVRHIANLENVTVGTTRWQPEIDGVRYVIAGARSRVFVDASLNGAIVPLRLPSDAPGERRVSIFLDGLPANTVTVRASEWANTILVLPEGGPHFRSVDLVVEGAPSETDGELLLVGKVRPIVGVR
jgi:hypothetical protein